MAETLVAKAAHFRAEAAKAMDLAQYAEDAESRQYLMQIAQIYERIADRHDPRKAG